ncbi:hypothetical protein FACS1894166_02680 [Bacilli bacterium]|nr:hypothetical protein FACS1894166_02680 [Bacilli bacterium]
MTRIPKTNSSRATTAIKKATSAATNIEVVEAQGNITKLKEHKYTHGQTSFIVKYEDGGLDGKPFSIRVVSDKVIRVVVNSSHSMLHKLLNDHQMGVAFQTDIIFPLCVCFAICKLNFDGERKDICKQFKGMTFDEIISDILKGRDDT